MKTETQVSTTHRLVLDESEQFDVTTKTSRPVTVRVNWVTVEQAEQGGEWRIRAAGKRILKSGKVGSGEKLDTWTYRNNFRGETQVELFGEMSQKVQDTLHRLGVTF
jgi:hypothetical protein